MRTPWPISERATTSVGAPVRADAQPLVRRKAGGRGPRRSWPKSGIGSAEGRAAERACLQKLAAGSRSSIALPATTRATACCMRAVGPAAADVLRERRLDLLLLARASGRRASAAVVMIIPGWQ